MTSQIKDMKEYRDAVSITIKHSSVIDVVTSEKGLFVKLDKKRNKKYRTALFDLSPLSATYVNKSKLFDAVFKVSA